MAEFESYEASRYTLDHLLFAREEELRHRREGEFNAANAMRDFADRFGRAGIEPYEVEWADRGQMLRGEESSEPDASGSVDQSVTPVGPVTSGIVSGIQGSAGGGDDVEGREVDRG